MTLDAPVSMIKSARGQVLVWEVLRQAKQRNIITIAATEKGQSLR
jgi:hypothetical protein